jgi:hypothetical protein
MSGPRVLFLGARRGIRENRWKDYFAEDGARLGWHVIHWNAENVPCDFVVETCRSQKIDILLWARTHKHNPYGDYERMLRQVEELGTITVGLHWDLYFNATKERAIQVGRDAFWSCQYVFTADGGHQKEFSQRGVNHFWCPPAIGRAYLGRGLVNSTLSQSYVFVGGFVPRIHGSHRESLINWAKKHPGIDFRWYGHSGSKSQVWGPGLNDLYSSARVVLGDSAESPKYWSNRVPEVMGRGGLLTHPRTVGMPDWGFNNSNMIPYTRGGFEEIRSVVEGMSSAGRKDMVDAGIALIESRHLVEHRLKEILRIVKP